MGIIRLINLPKNDVMRDQEYLGGARSLMKEGFNVESVRNSYCIGLSETLLRSMEMKL